MCVSDERVSFSACRVLKGDGCTAIAPSGLTQSKAIAAAEKGWQTLNAALTAELPSHDLSVDALDAESVKRFQSAMNDDLNTAAALAVLFELAKSIQREVNQRTHQGIQNLSDRHFDIAWQTLRQLAHVLGLEASQPTLPSLDLDTAWVETLLHQRQVARQEKRYTESDRIRNELQSAGITVVDRPGGKTEWHRS